MSFRLVPKSVTLNDPERRNGVILRYFSEFWQLGALRKSSRSLSHLLMSSCTTFRQMSVLKCPSVFILQLLIVLRLLPRMNGQAELSYLDDAQMVWAYPPAAVFLSQYYSGPGVAACFEKCYGDRLPVRAGARTGQPMLVPVLTFILTRYQERLTV